MTMTNEPLPPHLAEPPRLGTEISVTGKWTPNRQGRFRSTAGSAAMLAALGELQRAATARPGVLSSEIDHAVGEDGVLVHQVFADAGALIDYVTTAVASYLGALSEVATAGLHMVRGIDIPAGACEAIEALGAPVAVGEWIYGYVKHDYRRPDPDTAIQVTAKWACTSDEHLDELRHWWQRVGTDAVTLEEGLVRYEAYQVVGEPALVIHETFANSAELKFHLTKGTAARYKKDIDRIAAPVEYYFRGPVAWSIRTYSKFMRLPATYSGRVDHYTRSGGNHSDGLTESAGGPNG